MPRQRLLARECAPTSLPSSHASKSAHVWKSGKQPSFSPTGAAAWPPSPSPLLGGGGGGGAAAWPPSPSAASRRRRRAPSTLSNAALPTPCASSRREAVGARAAPSAGAGACFAGAWCLEPSPSPDEWDLAPSPAAGVRLVWIPGLGEAPSAPAGVRASPAAGPAAGAAPSPRNACAQRHACQQQIWAAASLAFLKEAAEVGPLTDELFCHAQYTWHQHWIAEFARHGATLPYCRCFHTERVRVQGTWPCAWPSAAPSGVKLIWKVSQSFTKSTQSSFATCPRRSNNASAQRDTATLPGKHHVLHMCPSNRCATP